MEHRIVVVGAGIIGLSTAVNIQELLPNVHVVIVADRFTTDTTSDGAAGLLFPSDRAKTIPSKLYKKWVQDSFDHFSCLARSRNSATHGVELISGYLLDDENAPEPFAKQFFVNFHRISEEEMKKIGHVESRFRYFATTFMASPRKYMPWLIKRFTENGGRFETRSVESFEEFVGNCDVVVNCTGLESRWLIGDNNLYPLRGQTIRVEAPWIKHFYFDIATHTSIFPTSDGVVLTITRQPNDYDTSIRPEESAHIMAVCCGLVPSLKDAKVIRNWTGLRPHRDEPRVEKDTLDYGTGSIKIVHNYGHGSGGIGLSWGTGVYAAELVKELTLDNKAVSKL